MKLFECTSVPTALECVVARIEQREARRAERLKAFKARVRAERESQCRAKRKAERAEKRMRMQKHIAENRERAERMAKVRKFVQREAERETQSIFNTCKGVRIRKRAHNSFSKEEAGTCGNCIRVNRFSGSYITVVTKSRNLY